MTSRFTARENRADLKKYTVSQSHFYGAALIKFQRTNNTVQARLLRRVWDRYWRFRLRSEGHGFCSFESRRAGFYWRARVGRSSGRAGRRLCVHVDVDDFGFWRFSGEKCGER